MRGYYLILHEDSFRRQDGVGKKMRWQIETFCEAGLPCEPYFFRVNREMEKLGAAGKAAYMLPGANFSPHWEADPRLSEADFLYFRHPPAATGPMRRALAALKRRNPALRVVMEIPTYPYEGELKGASRLLLLKDRRNRERLAGAVDALSVVWNGTAYASLWGLPVIGFQNGCRVAEIAPKAPTDDGCIDLLAVSRFSGWHGYDRLIAGMAAYYRAGGAREVRLHLVGVSTDGTLERYRALAEREGLAERVLFHGFQSGAALDALYDLADIGVSTMGDRGPGFAAHSDLKTREYLAKGLPLISGNVMDVLRGEDVPWYLEFPCDGTAIDLERVIAFYDRVYPAGCDRRALIGDIRDFARRTCDMSSTFAPVVEWIRNAGA